MVMTTMSRADVGVTTALLLLLCLALAPLSIVATTPTATGSATTSKATSSSSSSASSTWPTPPSQLAYCNRSPKPIPPLSPSSQAAKPELKQVQVFIRHGDRTLARANKCWDGDDAVWDCDLAQLQHTSVTPGQQAVKLGRVYRKQFIPGEEYLHGDCGIGQLTSIGHDQQHMNGANLRDAYITGAGLLPSGLEAAVDSMMLRSDNSQRTKESGQALISGMFPDDSVPPAPAASLVVPWYIRDEQVDDILPNAAVCPELTVAKQAAISSPEAARYFATVDAFLESIAKPLGIAVSDTEVGALFDCSYVHLCHSKAMPEAITEDVFNQIVNLTQFEENFLYTYNNSRYARLGMGALIAEAHKNMLNMIAGDSLPFWLYSGHDTGPMMPLLAALGVFNHKWCPYAGLASMELYSTATGSGYAVRLVYDGGALKMPGCGGELCDIKDFSALVGEIEAVAATCNGA